MSGSDVELDTEDASVDSSIYFDSTAASDDDETTLLWSLSQQTRRRQEAEAAHTRNNSIDGASQADSRHVYGLGRLVAGFNVNSTAPNRPNGAGPNATPNALTPNALTANHAHKNAHNTRMNTGTNTLDTLDAHTLNSTDTHDASGPGSPEDAFDTDLDFGDGDFDPDDEFLSDANDAGGSMYRDDEEEDEDQDEDQDDEEEEDDEDEDNLDLDDLDPAELLRQLILLRSRGADGIFGLRRNSRAEDMHDDIDHTNPRSRRLDEEDKDDEEHDHDVEDDVEDVEDEDGDEDDEDEDDDDLTSGRGGAFGARGGGHREFADVIQRLMGGGIIFGGGSSFNSENSEINALIRNLDQREDTYIVLELLNLLSERLLMMNGITAERLIPAARLARSLVAILEDPSLAEELELCLVASRCLYNFLEVNQDFVHEALSAGAVPVLCNKLMDVQYIDLTEQVLQTLEMIGRDRTSHLQIIENGGLLACLQYLDFFTIHAQRKALLIVSHACSGVSVSYSDKIIDVFSVLAQTAEHHNDAIVVEHAWTALLRVVFAFRADQGLLENLFCNKELLVEILKVIYRSLRLNKATNRSVGGANTNSNDNTKSSTPIDGHTDMGKIIHIEDPESDNIVNPINKLNESLSYLQNDSKQPISYSLCLSLIRLLIVLVSASTEISSILLQERIGAVVVQALLQYGNKDSTIILALMLAPKELLIQFLTLIGHLLPISYPSSEGAFLRAGFVSNVTKSDVDTKRSILCKNNNSYNLFVKDTWPLLLSAFQVSMDYEIRRRVFICVYRIVAFSGEELQNNQLIISNLDSVSTVLDSAISLGRSIVERGLDSKESLQAGTLLYCALQVVKTLISKGKLDAVASLEREGVINNLEELSRKFPIEDSKVQQDTSKVDNSSSIEQPSAISNTSATHSSSVSYVDAEFGRDYEIGLTDTFITDRICNVLHVIKISCEQLGHQQDSGGTLRTAQELADILRALTSLESGDLRSQLVKLAACLNKGASVFELLSSNIIGVLADLLDNLSVSQLKDFVYTFQGDFSELLRCMEDCLSRSENFEIVSSGAFSSSRLPDSKASSLVRQAKIKLLCLDDDLDALDNVVLSVQAIATFRTVESFLNGRGWILNPKIINNEKSESEREKSSRGRSIEFSINGEAVPTETTIYGAIYRLLQLKSENSLVVDTQAVWLGTHEVSYRHVPGPTSTLASPDPLNILYHTVPKQIEESELLAQDKSWLQTLPILRVIKGLYNVNKRMHKGNYAPGAPELLFANWKLTVKLNRQLEEPLVVASGTLPSWSVFVPQHFPMVFALDTRLNFLKLTSFGYSRLINHWQQRTNSENEGTQGSASSNSQPQLGHPVRHKVRLSRNQMLQSAVKMLNLYGLTPGILEIEYFNEVGSGLGPTLEFYSSVLHEFSSKRLHLWRTTEFDTPDSQYINGSLFPAPIAHLLEENSKKVLFFFSVLGKFIARSMLDLRIIDFNFNPLFLQMVLGIDEDDISLLQVDKQLASSVGHLNQYIELFKGVESIEERNQITINGTTIEDMSLSFEIPGYPNYDLGPQTGKSIDASNVVEFVEVLTKTTLDVSQQVIAFRQGFSKVFPISSIGIFLAEELAAMFGLAEEDWLGSTLTSVIKADHGYSKELDAIHLLVLIMERFLTKERRAFLQFLTGAPKLPVGGFKALRPELTVVKKPAEGGLTSDDYLPSVMTCANYLKLPEYLLESVMYEKLRQAMYEGAGAFLLS